MRLEGASEEILREILLYEEPHNIVVVDGRQFDPICTKLGIGQVDHSSVAKFPTWEAITSCWLVAKSHLEPNLRNKLEMLERAEEVCPGTTLVLENRAGLCILLDREEEAVDLMYQAFEKRPTARVMTAIWLLTGDETMRLRIGAVYHHTDIINLVLEEVKLA